MAQTISMTPPPASKPWEITNEQIRALKAWAETDDDHELVQDCDDALARRGGDARTRCGEALMAHADRSSHGDWD